jgi:hypothetical protein
MVWMEVMLAFGCAPGGDRVGLGYKPAESNRAAINMDSRLPFATVLIPGNPYDTAAIMTGSAQVTAILTPSHIPKVIYPIVRPVAVDVVNFLRPLSKGKRPCDLMSTVFLFEYGTTAIAQAIGLEEALGSGVSLVPQRAILRPFEQAGCARQPEEPTCIRLIPDQ